MTLTSWPRQGLVFLVELYRTWISPTRLPSCRFEPTCSAYSVEALTEWGAIRGGALSIIRLVKCGPWHKPGYDPVPERTRHASDDTDRHHGVALDGHPASDLNHPSEPTSQTSGSPCVHDAVRS